MGVTLSLISATSDKIDMIQGYGIFLTVAGWLGGPAPRERIGFGVRPTSVSAQLPIAGGIRGSVRPEPKCRENEVEFFRFRRFGAEWRNRAGFQPFRFVGYSTPGRGPGLVWVRAFGPYWQSGSLLKGQRPATIPAWGNAPG
jgi:hypothetical protein